MLKKYKYTEHYRVVQRMRKMDLIILPPEIWLAVEQNEYVARGVQAFGEIAVNPDFWEDSEEIISHEAIHAVVDKIFEYSSFQRVLKIQLMVDRAEHEDFSAYEGQLKIARGK